MDRKSIIILALAMALLFGLSPLVDHFFPPKPVPLKLQTSLTNNPEATNVAAVSTVTNMPSAETPVAPVRSTMPEQILTVSNQDLIWHFTSEGGGIKTIDLRDYPAVIKRTAAGGMAPPTPASLNTNAPLPVMTLVGGGIQGNNYFTVTRSGQTIRAEKTLPSGLRLVKEFDLGSNCFFNARISLENTTSKPLTVPQYELVVGTSTAVGPLDDPTAMGVIWYNGVKSQNIKASWFANRTLGCIPGTPREQYNEESSNVVWIAADNQFFVIAAIPSNPAPAVVIDKLRVPAPELKEPTNSMSASLTNGYQAALTYPATVLAPGQRIRKDFLIYAGPKEYNRLAQMGQTMNNNLDLIMGFSGVFGFFSKLLLISMNGLHDLGLQYGLTVIAITVILKLVFWPITKAGIRSQKRMQALQPQLKAIGDKYKDDPMKKHQKTSEFLKEQKVSQFGSCLPTVLQIPVFLGFYYMLRSAIELRGAHFLWAYDLSQPDTVAYIGGFPINPLPLIMGVSQLWQSQLTPPSPGMDPGQQKMMRFMPVLFIAMFYRMSAGLTLYWTVSNLLSILQTTLTRNIGDENPLPATVAVKKRK
ncbi:MAG TPA: membrane protein insertase YidC [Verrucomicrobiae bacterium]|jgi:YidC/Oxa1 family membrane protein insertase|nr:membrane protein insertase YidC [Verrucomicrobiae bacterium]